MLYSILIYDDQSVVDALSQEELAARLEKHIALQDKFRSGGGLRPVARLAPPAAATTVRKMGTAGTSTGDARDSLVVDGPFAETKEQLVGFYVLECASLDEAIEAAKMLPLDSSSLEIRPIDWYDSGV